MKLFFSTLCVALALFAVTVPATASADEKFKNLSVAIVDVQALLRESKAAKDIEGQAAELRKGFQADLTKEQSALRDAEKSLLQERGKMKPEEFQKKAEEFQKRVGDTERRVSERREKLDRALAEALNKLRGQIVEVVSKIGASKDIDMVVSRSEVVIVNKGLDITPEVMDELNKQMPSVKVSAP